MPSSTSLSSRRAALPCPLPAPASRADQRSPVLPRLTPSHAVAKQVQEALRPSSRPLPPSRALRPPLRCRQCDPRRAALTPPCGFGLASHRRWAWPGLGPRLHRRSAADACAAPTRRRLQARSRAHRPVAVARALCVGSTHQPQRPPLRYGWAAGCGGAVSAGWPARASHHSLQHQGGIVFQEQD